MLRLTYIIPIKMGRCTIKQTCNNVYFNIHKRFWRTLQVISTTQSPTTWLLYVYSWHSRNVHKHWSIPRKKNLQWLIGIKCNNLPPLLLVEAIQLIMSNNYFQFGNTYWKQISVVAMGTPAACMLATTTIYRFKNYTFKKQIPIFFNKTYFKYIMFCPRRIIHIHLCNFSCQSKSTRLRRRLRRLSGIAQANFPGQPSSQ